MDTCYTEDTYSTVLQYFKQLLNFEKRHISICCGITAASATSTWTHMHPTTGTATIH